MRKQNGIFQIIVGFVVLLSAGVGLYANYLTIKEAKQKGL